jgi:hypothetical protein
MPETVSGLRDHQVWKNRALHRQRRIRYYIKLLTAPLDFRYPVSRVCMHTNACSRVPPSPTPPFHPKTPP